MLGDFSAGEALHQLSHFGVCGYDLTPLSNGMCVPPPALSLSLSLSCSQLELGALCVCLKAGLFGLRRVVHTAVIYGAGVDGEFSYELWASRDDGRTFDRRNAVEVRCAYSPRPPSRAGHT